VLRLITLASAQIGGGKSARSNRSSAQPGKGGSGKGGSKDGSALAVQERSDGGKGPELIKAANGAVGEKVGAMGIERRK
jgi:hypothetical protein